MMRIPTIKEVNTRREFVEDEHKTLWFRVGGLEWFRGFVVSVIDKLVKMCFELADHTSCVVP